MSKILSLDVEKCTGCKMCELACSMKNNGEFNPQNSRIRVNNFHEKAYSVPVVCFQCEDAWCEKVCPSGAIITSYNSEKGIRVVQVSQEKCAGCKMCLLACPFGNIGFSDEGYAVKCNLCDGEPECVNYCARGALRFVEEQDSIKHKAKTIAEKILASYQK